MRDSGGADVILSHRYRFIFIKTAKTAGTSVEIALSKFCGEDDVITPLAPDDELIRARLGYRGPQNHLAPLSSYGLRDLARLALKRRKKIRFYNHMPAVEIRAIVGEEIWGSYYKFCFERNPWERFRSLHRWRGGSERLPIGDLLASRGPQILKDRGIRSYTIDGKIAVDRVCLYERLEDELEEVRLRLRLPEPLVLPRAKETPRTIDLTERDILTEEQRETIGELFAEEIALYGYEYVV